MVTKRGRHWIQRGVMTVIILAVIGLALGSWFTSEAIEGELLVVTAGESGVDPGVRRHRLLLDRCAGTARQLPGLDGSRYRRPFG